MKKGKSTPVEVHGQNPWNFVAEVDISRLKLREASVDRGSRWESMEAGGSIGSR